MSGLSVGSHIYVIRPGYLHHGLYIGSDQVIHYGGSDHGEDESDRVRLVRLSTFSRGAVVRVIAHNNPRFSAWESVMRACDRLGEDEYSLLTNNCEHFVNWCIEGKASSAQVKAGASAFGLVATQVARRLAVRGAAVAVGDLVVSNAGASVLTGGVGSALGIGTSTAASGLGAAGISSGLLSTAAVANPVGVTVVAGVAVGYAVYKLVAWMSD